ncbi:MAG TPA: fatty acid desaturase [Vicinamibacterales bacterium]|nr:fatty acid desaturase [Vicinamibacterales bacterium]
MSERSGYNGAPPYSELVADDGTTWLAYRRTLVPDYARAWREAVFSYAMLIAGFALHVALNRAWGNIAGLLLAPLSALWVGFWLHALTQFAHEGAHGHLAGNRKLNDLLADWLLWPLFALPIRGYRKSHMQHHVHLGDHLDTELSYYECLDPWYFLRAVTGLQVLVLVYRRIVKPKAAADDVEQVRGLKSGASEVEVLIALGRTVLLHGSVIAVALWFGLWGAALAWLFGFAVLYPAFNATRQILEHRSFEATCDIDFSSREHGALNRWFGDDAFSRYFGAAGVNRHLLHHWDPSVSYTNFEQMEAFILRTPWAGRLRASRTTYWRATVQMLRTAARH